MLRLNSGLRSGFEEPFKATMPEALDHGALYSYAIHNAKNLLEAKVGIEPAYTALQAAA